MATCQTMLFVVTFILSPLTNAGSAQNMNGLYTISNPNPAAPKQFSGDFTTYIEGNEYFDVYSPEISTVYGQVYWTMMDAVPLPKEIIERFDGKTMAITGYESNQVMRTANGDVFVPITAAYNHHYTGMITSKGASLQKIRPQNPHDPAAVHGHPDANGEVWTVTSATQYGSALLREGNGGEFRQTFHGYPRGFAELVDSPVSFSIEPMQIDTWNRDNKNMSGFVPGPEPQSSMAPRGNSPDHVYSGLLECPCTTRITTDVYSDVLARSEGTCGDTNVVTTAAECTHAVSNLDFATSRMHVTSASGKNASMPAGCLVVLEWLPGDTSGPHGITAYFNELQTSEVACGDMSVAADLFGAEYKQALGNEVGVELFFRNGTHLEITLAGPVNVWYGIGLNASEMTGTYAVVVDGDKGAVSEHILGAHEPGTILPDVGGMKILSSTISAGRRVVKMIRPLSGLEQHGIAYQGALANGKLPFIVAVGSGPQFAYHQFKQASTMTLFAVGEDTAAMAFGKGTGTHTYTPPPGEPGTTGSTVAGANVTTLGFSKDCLPYPQSTMLLQKNAECDIRTYTGGQSCCHHLFTLLDKNQTTPWVDQPLKYHMKFRVWFQEVNATNAGAITNVEQFNWGGLATPTEYDVPKCGPAVLGCSLENGTWVHTTNGTWTVREMIRGTPTGTAVQFRTIHGHCHAPTCVQFDLYNANTSELICSIKPVYGTSNETMNEKGYLSVPPCIFGDPGDGFMPPQTLPYDTQLFSTKKCRANYGHHGEMSLWQTYGQQV